MNDQTRSRRRVLQLAGVASTALIAGCSSGDSTDDQTPDSTGGGDTASGTPDVGTPDETATEEASLFVNYGIDGTDLSVELAEDALSRVTALRVETPSGQESSETSETVTQYSIDILRERAGTWYIDALGSDEAVIETVEFDTSFSATVEDIGTLAELAVTGESPAAEEVQYQLTVMNTGDVPVEPAEIQMDIPEFNARVDTIGTGAAMETYEEGTYGGVVDRDGEPVITAGSDNTYRYKSGNAASTLLIFEEDRANEIAGQSFNGELVISYQAEREDTVVPIRLDMGEEVVTDTDFTPYAYHRGTVIDKR